MAIALSFTTILLFGPIRWIIMHKKLVGAKEELPRRQWTEIEKKTSVRRWIGNLYWMHEGMRNYIYYDCLVAENQMLKRKLKMDWPSSACQQQQAQLLSWRRCEHLRSRPALLCSPGKHLHTHPNTHVPPHTHIRQRCVNSRLKTQWVLTFTLAA